MSWYVRKEKVLAFEKHFEVPKNNLQHGCVPARCQSPLSGLNGPIRHSLHSIALLLPL